MKAICILIISTLIASSVLFANDEVPTDCIKSQSSQSRVAESSNDRDDEQESETSSGRSN